MSTPTYQLHHLCIFEKQPRDAMWNWLRWYHAIPAYYWEGLPDLHHTGEGGVDYTFLACGGPFQMQMEAPAIPVRVRAQLVRAARLGHQSRLLDRAQRLRHRGPSAVQRRHCRHAL